MKYTWNTDPNADIWYNDEFDTIEDCILDAKENYDVKEGSTIAIGEVVFWEPYVDAFRVLERVEEVAWYECGEAADCWNSYDYKKDKEKVEQLSEKLTEIVKQWLKDNGTYPDFYKIENVRTVEVE